MIEPKGDETVKDGGPAELCTEDEWRARDDLRKHWHAFCDADVIPIDRDDFTDRLEKFDLITWRKVTRRDIEETSFAAEIGLELGGYCFDLTDKGERVLKARGEGQ